MNQDSHKHPGAHASVRPAKRSFAVLELPSLVFIAFTTVSQRKFMQTNQSRFLLTCMLMAMTWGGAGTACAQTTQPESAVSPKPITYLPANRESYLRFAGEADSMLRNDVLGVWFPRSVDNENGGFYSGFSRDWQTTKSEGKFSVFQGRMTWVAAQVVMHRPDLKDQYLPIVKHGVEYLNDVLWDKQYGGFYWGLDDKGKVDPMYTDGKELYGISFGMYGAAAAYQATHDPKALELAQKTFRWIDEHAHDTKNGGYFEWLTRDGKVVRGDPGAATLNPVPLALFPIGYKSMNTHIHLLESFTQLYEVWKDETLRKRLEELLAINRDKICVQPGVMNLYFTNDWRAIPDHDSYGHDIETAYLMLEAEDVLGHGHDPRTERMAKMLVDHALAYGWDETYGGFYQDGISFGKPESRLKEWWVEMEGLNSLLLMHEKYGKQTDVYFKAFQRQWQYIKNYQADSEFHGIYEMVGADGVPVNPNKGRIWKAAYHDGRALLNVNARLQKLADTATQ
jgi:mannobiose 2-epimerase